VGSGQPTPATGLVRSWLLKRQFDSWEIARLDQA
jgi:hypothetical protein